jgi:hypothetical protein
MITDAIIKRDYIMNVLDRDIRNIYSAQQLIAERNIYISGKELQQKKRKGSFIGRRTGALRRSLDNPDYTISGNGALFNVTSNIVLHMRFLDMKKIGNRQIYNRQVWGILYNNALRDIKYNVGDSIADSLGEELKRAFNDNSK